MADMVQPTHARLLCLTSLRDTFAGISGTIKVGLYKDSLTPTFATILADFVAAEADYSGYARIDAAFSTVTDNGSGDAHSFSTLATFTRGAGGVSNTIGGVMAMSLNSGGVVNAVLLFKDFVSPLDFSVVGATTSRLIEWLHGQYPIV